MRTNGDQLAQVIVDLRMDLHMHVVLDVWCWMSVVVLDAR